MALRDPFFFSKVWIFPLTSQGCCSPAPVCHQSMKETPWTYSKKLDNNVSRYLRPQAKVSSGLAEADVQLEPSAVDILIKYYCRESGVRNLKKPIEKVSVSVDANTDY